jgi:hypothetical protein
MHRQSAVEQGRPPARTVLKKDHAASVSAIHPPLT